MPDQEDNELKEALQGLRSTPAPPVTPREKTKRGPKPKVKDPMNARVGGDDLREGDQIAQIVTFRSAQPNLPAQLPNESFLDYALRVTNLNPPSDQPEVDPALLDIYNKEEYQENIESNKEVIEIKEEMTEKELKFIRLYLIDHVPAKIALVAAGYRKYNDTYASTVAQKIKKKYECSTQGAEILSDLNFGAVEIAQGIIDIARTCPNAQVRLNALALCAKAAGLLKEAADQAPGVTIVIKGRDQGVDAPGGREPAPYTPTGPSVAVQVNGPVALTK